MAAKYQPLRNHESVLVFYRASPPYNPQMTQGRPYGGFASTTGATVGEVYGKGASRHRANPEGTRYPLTVQDFRMEKGWHPTQKPVALGEYLIRTYTNPGDTVLDPTMGSGSFGVAALNQGRRFVGIELDPGYFAVAQRRLAESEAAKRPKPPDLLSEVAA